MCMYLLTLALLQPITLLGRIIRLYVMTQHICIYIALTRASCQTQIQN